MPDSIPIPKVTIKNQSKCNTNAFHGFSKRAWYNIGLHVFQTDLLLQLI